jgi:hypothetical protein
VSADNSADTTGTMSARSRGPDDKTAPGPAGGRSGLGTIRRGAITAASLSLVAIFASQAGAGSLAGATAVNSIRSVPFTQPRAATRPHVMLDVPATQAARRADGLRPANSPITGYLHYEGGSVLTGATVYLVFWGFTSDPSGERKYLEKFMTEVQPTLWVNDTSQYCENVPTGSAGCLPQPSLTDPHAHVDNSPLAGVWNDPSTPPANPGSPTAGADQAIQNEATRAYSHFGEPGGNPIFLVATPTGDQSVSTGFGSTAAGGWCAYHNSTSFVGTSATVTIQYIDLPYITDAGIHCGKDSVNGKAGLDDGISIVAGHELAEAVTDPVPGQGWVDASGNEVADKCAWYHLQDIQTNNGQFAVQPLWSNRDYGCVDEYLQSWIDAGSSSITNVSVGADNVEWAVLKSGHLERADCLSECPFTAEPGTGVQVAVDPKGRPWLVNASHQLYHWNGKKFVQLKGTSARYVSVGTDGVTWIVGTTKAKSGGYELYKYAGNDKWTREPGSGVSLAVGPMGNPWLLNASHQLYHWTGKKWQSRPGLGIEVAIGSAGQLWMLGEHANSKGLHALYVMIDGVWVPAAEDGYWSGTSIAVYQDDIVSDRGGQYLQYATGF